MNRKPHLTKRERKVTVMRYIQIPASFQVRIKNPQPPTGPAVADTMKSTTFIDTLCDVWLNHAQEFGATANAVRSAAKIAEAFEGKNPGDWVAIEDADFQKLEKAVETTGYNPAVARQLIPFMDAVANATKKNPALSVVRDQDTDPGPNGPSAE